jgi:peptidoglycan/LPS O-acetylase OafA/YrhL
VASLRVRATVAPVIDDASTTDDRRRRLTTVFGWVAGGSLGLLLNYLLFLAIGDGYPTVPTTFVLFLAGAFGGMSLADRLGPRGFKPLGIAAGILLALFVALVLAVLMSPADVSPT